MYAGALRFVIIFCIESSDAVMEIYLFFGERVSLFYDVNTGSPAAEDMFPAHMY